MNKSVNKLHLPIYLLHSIRFLFISFLCAQDPSSYKILLDGCTWVFIVPGFWDLQFYINELGNSIPSFTQATKTKWVALFSCKTKNSVSSLLFPWGLHNSIRATIFQCTFISKQYTLTRSRTLVAACLNPVGIKFIFFLRGRPLQCPKAQNIKFHSTWVQSVNPWSEIVKGIAPGTAIELQLQANLQYGSRYRPSFQYSSSYRPKFLKSHVSDIIGWLFYQTLLVLGMAPDILVRPPQSPAWHILAVSPVECMVRCKFHTGIFRVLPKHWSTLHCTLPSIAWSMSLASHKHVSHLRSRSYKTTIDFLTVHV